MNHSSSSSNSMNSTVFKVEKKLTIILFIYILGFLLTWLPYGIVSLYSVCIKSDHFSPLVSMLVILFTKTSIVWSTLFYLITNKKLKSKIAHI